MTFGRYLVGMALALASVLFVAAGAYAVRRRLLPEWTGAPARLVEAVVAIACLIVVAQVLGLVGLLHPAALSCGCVLAGGALWLAATRKSPPPLTAPAPRAPPPDRVAALVALAAGAVVTAAWCTRLLPALDRGMSGADTLWYHLPQAAGFAQDGSITHVQFFETGAGTAFYPATAALFHALGMVWLGSDFLSPFLNFGWLGLGLLAGWCLGRPYGLGPASMVGVSLVLATPIMVETQPASGYNDVAGLALFLAAAALLVNGGPTGVPGLMAALAAGPALGTKLSFAAPLVALGAGAVAIAPAGRRLRTAGLWLAAPLILGGIWYARNLIAFGNPIPALDLEVGPISLPSPPLTNLTFAPVHYFGTPGVWGEYFRPGLLRGFGPAWWALLALSVAGMVAAALAGRGRTQRMLGVVAIVSAAAYLFTPQGLGTETSPSFFEFNLRYPTPALALGLGLLPLVPRLARQPQRELLLAVFAGVLLATQLDPAIWPLELREQRFAEPAGEGTSLAAVAIGAGLLLAVAAGVGLRRRVDLRARSALALAAGAAAVAVLAAWFVQRDYLRDRYTRLEPLAAVYDWARDVKDARIATVGFFLSYPLYGLDLSNRVEYVADHGPHGAFTRIQSCRGWRAALNSGGYRYVVTTPFNYPGNLTPEPPKEASWTRSDPAAHLVLREPRVVSLFRLDGRLDPDGCPRGRD